MLVFFICTNLILTAVCFYLLYKKINKNEIKEQLSSLENRQSNSIHQLQSGIFEQFLKFNNEQQKIQKEHNQQSNHQHLDNLNSLQGSIKDGIKDIMGSFEKLTSKTENQLNEINHRVEQRLNAGFEKTAKTFQDIVERLALIDAAQKKITELSNNVVNLQEILSDKRSRGAFGEVQLKNLIQNSIPSEHFKLQHTLSNNTRVDCLLVLPAPTGNIAIDAKFPLENYQRLTAFEAGSLDKKAAEQSFKADIKKHITDIAQKYIIPGETSNGAIMFIPAEAVFATIHSNFPDLVQLSQKNNIWIASPTTMMAILTTASAVLKDSATKKHIHIIQKHLSLLAKDFQRFEDRMNKLSRHLQQANDDAQSIQVSATKISKRFTQIEHNQVETDNIPS